MQQANWMSLGIIVTHFACMVQRLVSSMRPTTYASAASCRHIMVLPWKCRSVLPMWRAISRTSCEKGSFLIRSLVLFWNHQISQRATVPGWYFLVFFTFPAMSNSFWGALPPMVGQSFLVTNSSPKADGPSLHSHLGQLLVWWWWWWPTHILKQSSLLYLPLSLFQHLLHLSHRWGLPGWGRGGALEKGASSPS